MWFSTPIFVSCTTDASNLDFEIQNTTGSGSFITVPGSTFDMTVEGVDGFPGEYILLATFFTPSPVVCSVGILLSWSDCLSSLIAPQQNMSQSQSASQSTSASQSSSGSLSQSQSASTSALQTMSASQTQTPSQTQSASLTQTQTQTPSVTHPPRCYWASEEGTEIGDSDVCLLESSCFARLMAAGGSIQDSTSIFEAFTFEANYAAVGCSE